MNAAGAAVKRRAEKWFSGMMPFVCKLIEQDLSLSVIAKKLNDAGYRTTKGTHFTPQTVCSLVKRAKSIGLVSRE